LVKAQYFFHHFHLILQEIFFHSIEIKMSLCFKYLKQGILFPGLPCLLKFYFSKLGLEIFLFSEEKLLV